MSNDLWDTLFHDIRIHNTYNPHMTNIQFIHMMLQLAWGHNMLPHSHSNDIE